MITYFKSYKKCIYTTYKITCFINFIISCKTWYIWSYIIITNIKSNTISSSYIRDELKEKNYNLNDYLDQKVIDYIKENNLYI